jgi:hypothetical protein
MQQQLQVMMPVSILLTGFLQAEHVQANGINPVFAKHGIKVERIADAPGAEARFSRLVGPEVAAQINPALKPHILLIENGSNVAITEIHSVLYRYPAPGAQGIPGITAIRTNGIPPGDFFIVGPLHQALMDKAKRGVAPPPGLAKSQADFVASNLDARRFQFAESVIDAIVLSDGRVLGPDRTGVIAHRRAGVTAMQQVLAKLADRSLTEVALKQWLANEAATLRPPVLKADHMPDHEKMQQFFGLATMLQQRLQEVGREQVTADLARMLASETASVNNLKPVKE